MIELSIIILFAIEQAVLFNVAYRLGIKTEQQARLRRINALKKLLDGKV